MNQKELNLRPAFPAIPQDVYQALMGRPNPSGRSRRPDTGPCGWPWPQPLCW